MTDAVRHFDGALTRLLVLAGLLLSSAAGSAQIQTAWVPSWTASLYRLEADARIPDDQLTNATLRQAVRLSIGGRRIRVVLSNIAGMQSLAIGGVHVAMSGPPGSASILPESDREVRFNNRSDITVPAGGEAISDAVELLVPPLARLSISMHFVASPADQSGHLRSLSTSWLRHGEHLSAATLSPAVSAEHWYQLASVQVEAPDPHVIVAFGDSITDGSRSTPNTNSRWPDLLAERLQASPETNHWTVVNAGLAGNRLLTDSFGPSALARFDRDVLSQPHVRTVVLLEGINDLGHGALGTQLIRAYQQLISRAHVRGVRLIGATLMPYNGSDYHPTLLDESERRAVNDWIRTSRQFDAVIDWDVTMRDPGDPSRLRPEFDSGDHIHPSPSGYRAMVDAISIAELVE